jgi:hypothetical protein
VFWRIFKQAIVIASDGNLVPMWKRAKPLCGRGDLGAFSGRSEISGMDEDVATWNLN